MEKEFMKMLKHIFEKYQKVYQKSTIEKLEKELEATKVGLIHSVQSYHKTLTANLELSKKVKEYEIMNQNITNQNVFLKT